jgi:hypothetical protein
VKTQEGWWVTVAVWEERPWKEVEGSDGVSECANGISITVSIVTHSLCTRIHLLLLPRDRSIARRSSINPVSECVRKEDIDINIHRHPFTRSDSISFYSHAIVRSLHAPLLLQVSILGLIPFARLLARSPSHRQRISPAHLSLPNLYRSPPACCMSWFIFR